MNLNRRLIIIVGSVCCLLGLLIFFIILFLNHYLSQQIAVDYYQIGFILLCLILVPFNVWILYTVSKFKTPKLIDEKSTSADENESVLTKIIPQRMTRYNHVTSLPNHLFFNEILAKSIHHAKRHEQILAVLIIGLDGLQYVQSESGKDVIDIILNEFANRFEDLLRSDDIIAHYGPDEFIILLNDINQTKFAGTVAHKILESSLNPINIQGRDFVVNVSIGIAVYPSDGDSLESQLDHAESAMRKAKQAGGGRYHYSSSEMETVADEYIKLESGLRHALTNNELVLHYQPQFNLATGTIDRVEALIRWEHPKLGLLGPDYFIPMAEETGLIIPIGTWALHEACRACKKWINSGYKQIVICVNMSPKQFYQQDMAAIIKNALQESDLAPESLEVEITETAVMRNIDSASVKLSAIHNMGVRIAIDDFGTGYTSISYLKQFPVNVLKIDKTYIHGLPGDSNDRAITSAVIALGKNLGLNVVAEGVESKEQIEFLYEHNCDYIQGYYIGSPISADKVSSFFIKSE